MTKRTNYITWDEYFMGVAKLSSKRSKDPNTQVGACIVNDDKRIIGIGYNGFPYGISDDDFPWGKDGARSETKYPYVVHAEANALLNSTVSLKDSIIYVTLFPCAECMKLIIQSRIKEIVYCEIKNIDSEDTKASLKMAKYSKINIRKMNYEE